MTKTEMKKIYVRNRIENYKAAIMQSIKKTTKQQLNRTPGKSLLRDKINEKIKTHNKEVKQNVNNKKIWEMKESNRIKQESLEFLTLKPLYRLGTEMKTAPLTIATEDQSN